MCSPFTMKKQLWPCGSRLENPSERWLVYHQVWRTPWPGVAAKYTLSYGSCADHHRRDLKTMTPRTTANRCLWSQTSYRTHCSLQGSYVTCLFAFASCVHICACMKRRPPASTPQGQSLGLVLDKRKCAGVKTRILTWHGAGVAFGHAGKPELFS